jgi:hypothetical protein
LGQSWAVQELTGSSTEQLHTIKYGAIFGQIEQHRPLWYYLKRHGSIYAKQCPRHPLHRSVRLVTGISRID